MGNVVIYTHGATDPAKPWLRAWHACPPVVDYRDADRIAEAYRASGQYEDVKVVDCRNAARMVRG